VRALRAWLAENWPLKLVAIAFAMGLWLFVATEDQADAVFSVPIDFVDRPAGLEVTSLAVESAVVRVAGRRSLLRQVQEGDFRAEVSLRGAGPGRFVAPLQPDNVVVPRGLRVIRVAPSEVRATLERR
jgi:hypothetical protein